MLEDLRQVQIHSLRESRLPSRMMLCKAFDETHLLTAVEVIEKVSIQIIQKSDLRTAIPYTAAVGHLAPDTDMEVKHALCRKPPQPVAVCCYQVSDKDANVPLRVYQSAC